jgi:hypothetical protein
VPAAVSAVRDGDVAERIDRRARAVLSAREDDAGARRLYHASGWQEIGRDLALVPGGDPYVILARRLAGHPG